MSKTQCKEQLELFEVGRQQVTITFDGGQIVSDAGLLPIRELDRKLGILAGAARLLPDPRAELAVIHSAEDILTQQVYQILAGYPDGNDAQLLRDDPLFKTIVGKDPRGEDNSLASGSTINRFQHAFTRREVEKPIEEREVIFEVRRAQIERINAINDFLIDLFVRTRKEQPAHIIIDLDPTADPTHGQQQLTMFNGFYDQHQYFPMLLFEGETGFPLGAWLRHGTAHAGLGAVEMIRRIVERLRQHWPDIMIFVRGDAGVSGPEMYEYCEAQGILYAFGYGTNSTLKQGISELELEDNARLLWWMSGCKPLQRFHTFEDYQARSWSRARRIVTKVEITQLGSANVRFVVTNMSGHAGGIYQGFYVQRGNVPERPIGELKNGLHMDRLSSHRFLANSHKLMTHMLAYALYVLFREANAKTPEVNTMEIGTARTRLFKVGALVQATHRHIWFRVASHWPGQTLLTRAAKAVQAYVRATLERWQTQNLFASRDKHDPCDRSFISFAPLPLK
jgi:hypothetical protein